MEVKIVSSQGVEKHRLSKGRIGFSVTRNLSKKGTVTKETFLYQNYVGQQHKRGHEVLFKYLFYFITWYIPFLFYSLYYYQ